MIRFLPPSSPAGRRRRRADRPRATAAAGIALAVAMTTIVKGVMHDGPGAAARATSNSPFGLPVWVIVAVLLGVAAVALIAKLRSAGADDRPEDPEAGEQACDSDVAMKIALVAAAAGVAAVIAAFAYYTGR